MWVLKGAVVLATIGAAAASLSACRKEIDDWPLKMGTSGISGLMIVRY